MMTGDQTAGLRERWLLWKRDAKCDCTDPDPAACQTDCEPSPQRTRECPCHYLTAAAAGRQDNAGLRERLAEALRDRLRQTLAPVRSPWGGEIGNIGGATEYDLADVLLPVVEAHTAEQTARLRRDCQLYADAASAAERTRQLQQHDANQYEAQLRQQIDELAADRDRLAAEVAELRQIVAAPVSAASGPEFGRALVGKVGELVDERRHYAIAAKAIGRVRAECDRIEAAVHDNPQGADFDGAYLACLRHIRAALNGTGEA